jgi:hypothetical protein
MVSNLMDYFIFNRIISYWRDNLYATFNTLILMKTITDSEIKTFAKEYADGIFTRDSHDWNLIVGTLCYGATWYRSQIEQTDWISVDERLPEDEITDKSNSCKVLAWLGDSVEILHRSFVIDGDGYYEWANDIGIVWYNVTHWQSLPSAPTLVDQRKEQL